VKIKAIRYAQIEASEAEVKAMQTMFRFYADNTEDTDNVTASILKSFGVERSVQEEGLEEDFDGDEEQEHEESLPEKALRITEERRRNQAPASHTTTTGQRKGRVRKNSNEEE